ncbi:MAG TPA: hypothetical protein VMC44_06070 [Geobacteraceae bacterium]|nr:hypothetical protein [Geobacteraceae bacterium]
MGTLAAVPAGKKIQTPEALLRAEVEGDIEIVNGVLKITTIRVKYRLKVPEEKANEAREAFEGCIAQCPAAQSLIGCIAIKDELLLETLNS